MSNPFLERAKQFGLQQGEMTRSRQISVDLPPPPVGYNANIITPVKPAAPALATIVDLPPAPLKLNTPPKPAEPVVFNSPNFNPPAGSSGPPPAGGNKSTSVSLPPPPAATASVPLPPPPTAAIASIPLPSPPSAAVPLPPPPAAASTPLPPPPAAPLETVASPVTKVAPVVPAVAAIVAATASIPLPPPPAAAAATPSVASTVKPAVVATSKQPLPIAVPTPVATAPAVVQQPAAPATSVSSTIAKMQNLNLAGSALPPPPPPPADEVTPPPPPPPSNDIVPAAASIPPPPAAAAAAAAADFIPPPPPAQTPMQEELQSKLALGGAGLKHVERQPQPPPPAAAPVAVAAAALKPVTAAVPAPSLPNPPLPMPPTAAAHIPPPPAVAAVAPTHIPPPPAAPAGVSSADQNLFNKLTAGGFPGAHTSSKLISCAKCTKPITGPLLEIADGRQFHPECYTCFKCNQPVTENILTVNNQPYHAACVVCITCGCDLTCSPFGVHPTTGALFCPTHARQARNSVANPPGQPPPPPMPAPPSAAAATSSQPPPPPHQPAANDGIKRCQGCQQPTANSTESLIAVSENAVYHARCLVCADCRTQLNANGNVYERNGHFYCENDFHNRFGLKCHGCAQTIKDGSALSLESGGGKLAFHQACFNCFQCQTPLKGQSFYLNNNRLACEKHA